MQHSDKFLKIVNDAKSRVRETNVADVKKRRAAGEQFLLVDVREDNEWKDGHATDAIHLGKGVIERDITKMIPDTNTKVVLYCGGGYRSALAADSIQKMGYTNVESMDGGFRAWVEEGMPTSKD
jgi:rhodanese-related sulfurtransferase